MKHLFALLLLILPSASLSEGVNHWSYVGAWDVDYYPAMRGCSATVEFNGGISFLIGIDASSNQAQVAIAILHQGWDSINRGADYDLTVQFDSRSPWDVTATGVYLDSLYGLVITEPVDSGNAAAFVREFQRGYWMTWRHQGDTLGKLSLKDSRRAFDAALNCSQAYLR